MAALLMAGAVMTACSGGDDITSDIISEPQSSTEAGVVELSGTLGSKSSVTRAIDDEGKGSWEKYDEFAIYYQTNSGHATATATVNRVNDDGSADFTATLISPKTGSNNVTFVYPVSAYDGNGGFKTDALMNQKGTLDYINEKGLDIETASTTMNVVNTKATLNSDVTMLPQVCLYTLNLKKDANNDLYATKLEISDGTHNYTVAWDIDTNTFTVALLPVSGANFTFEATTEEVGRVYTKQNVTLETCTENNVGHVFDKDGNIYEVTNKVPGVLYGASFNNITLTRGKFYSQNLTLAPVVITPVAMIAYVGEKGTADTSEGAENYHGLAMAMSNVTDSEGTYNFAWALEGYGDQEKCDGVYNFDGTVDNYLEPGNFKGIDDTNILANHTCSNNHRHPAAEAAKNYRVEGFNPHDIKCSDWFLPTTGQWYKFFLACEVEYPFGSQIAYGAYYYDMIVTNKMNNAGANYINNTSMWTTSQTRGTGAAGVTFVKANYTGGNSGVMMWQTSKTEAIRVRPFLAF